jgi:hypothetical protein
LVWTWGLAFAGQALYHLSHAPCPSFLSLSLAVSGKNSSLSATSWIHFHCTNPSF